MADIYTQRKRSAIMSRIRSTATGPEQRLYDLVRSVLGYRWRIDKNVQHLPGRPDILIPSLKLIFFCDGCFYHSCPSHGHEPKSNRTYWVPKLARNRRRDSLNRSSLRARGFQVVRIWEHDLRARQMAQTRRKLIRILARYVPRMASNHAERAFPPHIRQIR
jgi:DNA mismatch endonuclease, patch repair protein